MKNVSHMKGWNLVTNQARVGPLPIHLIKKTCNGNLDEDFVKIKFRRDPTSNTSDLYEFNMFF